MARQFECFQDGCNFMVRADSEEEVVHLVQEHAQSAHGISIDEETVVEEIERT
jgi:predicted small metal-binding protein